MPILVRLFLLIALATIASAVDALPKYFGVARDRDGHAIPGAHILVTASATGATATLYADDETTTKANPIIADADGSYEFKVASSIYDITTIPASAPRSSQVRVSIQVNEVVSSTVSTLTNFTTADTIQQLATIALTPGDWLETVTVTYYGNGATVAAINEWTMYLDDTTASATGAVQGETIGYGVEEVTGSLHNTVTLTYRESITTAKSKYLNAKAQFSGGNPQYACSIKAVRLH